MDNKTKRILFFMLGCVVVRIGLVLLAKNIPEDKLSYMGYLALVPAIGFSIIYLGGLRKTGGEVFGDIIWWNNLRPIHALLYFIFAYMAINKNQNAYKVLLGDVILGVVAFMGYHFKNLII